MAARLLKGNVEAMTNEQRAALASGDDHGDEGAGWFGFFQNAYRRLLSGMLRVRWLILLATAVLFVISMFTFRSLGTELFPQTDSGQLAIQVRATTGLRIENTEKLVVRIEKAILDTVPASERQILMTGLAAGLGLTPMAITGGANIPLARAVVGGVIAAVILVLFLVLFVVPPLFVTLKRHTPATA